MSQFKPVAPALNPETYADDVPRRALLSGIPHVPGSLAYRLEETRVYQTALAFCLETGWDA